MSGKEAVSIAAMLQFADTLQLSIKAALKENADMYSRFMPLAEMVSMILNLGQYLAVFI